MNKRKYRKKRKRGYQNSNRYNVGTKFWISSNCNDFIQKESGMSVYFMVEFIENEEDREKYKLGNINASIPYKTTVLTEREFHNVKGFVPIKPKKFYLSRSNGRFGTRSFGFVKRNSDDIEKAIARDKFENREDRLSKLLD